MPYLGQYLYFNASPSTTRITCWPRIHRHCHKFLISFIICTLFSQNFNCNLEKKWEKLALSHSRQTRSIVGPHFLFGEIWLLAFWSCGRYSCTTPWSLLQKLGLWERNRICIPLYVSMSCSQWKANEVLRLLFVESLLRLSDIKVPAILQIFSLGNVPG